MPSSGNTNICPVVPSTTGLSNLPVISVSGMAFQTILPSASLVNTSFSKPSISGIFTFVFWIVFLFIKKFFKGSFQIK